jgi:uncharacterized YccA/Bax inhibitor family protein
VTGSWWALLRPWPLLIGAIAAIAAAVLVDPAQAGGLAISLAVLGAVCLGAFIALLAVGLRAAPPPDQET